MNDKDIGTSWNNLCTAGCDYGVQLHSFRQHHHLPDEWFAVLDHVAIKCYDQAHYGEMIAAARAYATRITELPQGGRMLATAELVEPIEICHFGFVSWVEIMEPRPEKVGDDIVGLDHVEFFYADFASVERALDERGIAYERQSNPSHEWISLSVGEDGPELKLNNGLLAEIVVKELAEGASRIVWKR